MQSRVNVECILPLFTSEWRPRDVRAHRWRTWSAINISIACTWSAISISNCIPPWYHCLLYGHMVQMDQWRLRLHSSHRIRVFIGVVQYLDDFLCNDGWFSIIDVSVPPLLNLSICFVVFLNHRHTKMLATSIQLCVVTAGITWWKHLWKMQFLTLNKWW